MCFVGTFRRAVLKDCFEGLQKQIPSFEDRRKSHLDVLQMAVKYVQVWCVHFSVTRWYLWTCWVYAGGPDVAVLATWL